MRDIKDTSFKTRFRSFTARVVQLKTLYAVSFCAALIIAVVILSIVPLGASTQEVDFYNESSTIAEIIDNPLSFPYKISSFVVTNFLSSVRTARALSIILFGLCVVALYHILKRWHSTKIALFTTALFATNATVLAVARLGTSLGLLLTWTIVLSLLLWFKHGRSSRIAPLSVIVFSAILLYLPGAPYFFLLFLVMFAPGIKSAYSTIPKFTRYISFSIGVILLLPLIYSIAQETMLLREWLLLPQTIDWGAMPRNILRVPSAFLYRAPIDPLINVGSLPVLDVATSGLFLLGLYSYFKNRKLERVKIVLLSGLFAIILGALGQVTAGIIIVIPFVYAVIAAGINILLTEWHKVFPHNPFARSFGLMLIIVMLSFSVYYQLNRFLVVWPQTPETRQEYNQPRLLQYIQVT